MLAHFYVALNNPVKLMATSLSSGYKHIWKLTDNTTGYICSRLVIDAVRVSLKTVGDYVRAANCKIPS